MLLDAFLPDDRYPRPNGDVETSINWEDNANVEARTLSDPNGEFGAARVKIADVARTLRQEKTAAAFAVERTPDSKNTHHGDIVYRAATAKAHRKMIANGFALLSSFVPPAQK